MKTRSVLAALFMMCAPALAAQNQFPEVVQPTPDPDLKHPARTYSFCVELARVKPEQGIEVAGKWVGLGGGEPARHCQAIALIGLKEYGEAATRLEALANELKSPGDLRAGMLGQAAQAWLLQGDPNKAYGAQTAALKLVTAGGKAQADLYIDRALTLSEGGKYTEAMSDLNAALDIAPSNADALAFRASAHRHLGDLDAALTDAEKAVASNSKNANALLERGTLYQLKDRIVDARHDWVAAIELDPNSDAANAARDAIERADVKPDAPVKKK